MGDRGHAFIHNHCTGTLTCISTLAFISHLAASMKIPGGDARGQLIVNPKNTGKLDTSAVGPAPLRVNLTAGAPKPIVNHSDDRSKRVNSQSSRIGGHTPMQLATKLKVNCKDTTTRSNGPSNGPASRIGIASAQPEPEDPACKCKFVSSGLIEQVEDFHPKELSDCIVLLRNVQKGTEEQRRQKFCSNHTIVLTRKLSPQTEAVGINHIATRIGQLAGKHEALT